MEEYSKDFKIFEKDPEKVLDSTDGIRDTFKGIIESIEEEVEHLTDIRLEKKLISILVNGKYSFIEKIKKIVKIATETTLKVWAEQKQP